MWRATVSCTKCTTVVNAAAANIHPSAMRVKGFACLGAHSWMASIRQTRIGAISRMSTSAMARQGSGSGLLVLRIDENPAMKTAT
jgi:hypothetical protein